MARGLSESSEFVTKRMCFSFLLSVGFLCLLCGFLLGRFATQRAIEFRAEKKRFELAGNGLESTEYLQRLVLEQLKRAPLDLDFEVNWKSFTLREDDIRRANGILSNLSLVHSVVDYQSYIVATVQGSREPDRYVVLSVSDEGVGIALKLAKILNDIQREHGWKPRRSLIFCLFFGPTNPCTETLSSFMRHRVLAYVAVHHQALQGRGPLIVSGSDAVKSAVLEAANIVRNLYSYNDQVIPLFNVPYNSTITRLALDIPHAVLSFMNNNFTFNDNDHQRELRKIILAQILSQTIWRLSECLIMTWNPTYFNETVSKALASINSTELLEMKEKIQDTSIKLLNNIEILNGRINTIDSTNTLDTRISNDLMMDLDRALLCSDTKSQSKTNWSEVLRLSHESDNIMYFNEMVKCYETAIKLLQNR
ncbi:hypothetical protein WN55_10139 [Dufourea novaeangliae]|uniref:Uncharacterized protein n=2 Tax=Dufourea novaeangliae TaxID=178035 RepID=A0A154P526_DUFNO|nr:hypothetical protein WN55_10139 [Dufourea novaeangliae]